MNPWTKKKSECVYSNKWISVHHEEVIDPSGAEGIYGRVHFKNKAVGVLPIDHDGNTYLVGQYRYPLDEYSWEIPEGGSPEGQSTLESAKRELVEETGIKAKDWSELMELHTSNSVTDEYAIVYLARDLQFGQAMPESTEDLKIKKLPVKEAIRWVVEGKITDAISVAAILKYSHLYLK